MEQPSSSSLCSKKDEDKKKTQIIPPRLLLLSNSKLHGEEPYQWCADYVKSFFLKSSVTDILFIPYACQDYGAYTKKVRPAFEKLGLNITSIHEQSDPVIAVKNAKGIFIGGGNTFLLLKTLYEKQLVETIRDCVLKKGIPYMGASAGTNVATRSIHTTNDMPICCPPSFDALNLVTCNINPHFIDADPNSKHMGETREERIKEYLEQSHCAPVLGLREGSGLFVEDMVATLIGFKPAILFQKDKEPESIEIGSKVLSKFITKE